MPSLEDQKTNFYVKLKTTMSARLALTCIWLEVYILPPSERLETSRFWPLTHVFALSFRASGLCFFISKNQHKVYYPSQSISCGSKELSLRECAFLHFRYLREAAFQGVLEKVVRIYYL